MWYLTACAALQADEPALALAEANAALAFVASPACPPDERGWKAPLREVRAEARAATKGGGKDGGAEQKAASVASLLGDGSVAQTLINAVQRFRAQPLSTLTINALLTSEPDASLYANSVPAKLGEVHAFMSHSWSDDGKLKYERLHVWARELGGDDDKLVWLDKACIDQAVSYTHLTLPTKRIV